MHSVTMCWMSSQSPSAQIRQWPDTGVRPSSTLLGEGAVGQIVLTKHFDMDAELPDLSGGEGTLQDMMGSPIEASDGDVEETHVAVD